MPDTVLPTGDRATVQKESAPEFLPFCGRGCATGNTVFCHTSILSSMLPTTQDAYLTYSNGSSYPLSPGLCQRSLKSLPLSMSILNSRNYLMHSLSYLSFVQMLLIIRKNANILPMTSKARCDLVCCYTIRVISYLSLLSSLHPNH